MKSLRRTLAVALLALLGLTGALALSGCGDSSDVTEPDGAAAPEDRETQMGPFGAHGTSDD